MGRHGFPGIFPAKVWHAAALVLREASALMRISSIIIIIVIFAENASFRSYARRRHLLASMPLTTPKPQNTDTNGIHATLLFAI